MCFVFASDFETNSVNDVAGINKVFSYLERALTDQDGRFLAL